MPVTSEEAARLKEEKAELYRRVLTFLSKSDNYYSTREISEKLKISEQVARGIIYEMGINYLSLDGITLLKVRKGETEFYKIKIKER